MSAPPRRVRIGIDTGGTFTDMVIFDPTTGEVDSLKTSSTPPTPGQAIVNALVAARTMTGKDGKTVHAIPHERLREILRRHGRLSK